LVMVHVLLCLVLFIGVSLYPLYTPFNVEKCKN
jgi:hypothetical protein